MVLIFILFSTASENTPLGLFFFPIISMEVLQKSFLKTFFTDHATMEYSHIAIRVLSYSKISILSRMPNFFVIPCCTNVFTLPAFMAALKICTPFLNSFLFAYNFKNTFADLFWPVYACIEITSCSVHRTEYGNVSSSETSITTLILLYFNSR